ncbi:MAG: hypothetical protein ACOCP8_08735 [archaeon]
MEKKKIVLDKKYNIIVIITLKVDNKISVEYDSIEPISYEKAKEKNRESLRELLFQLRETSGEEIEDKERWIDDAIEEKGELSELETSVYDKKFNITKEKLKKYLNEKEYSSIYYSVQDKEYVYEDSFCQTGQDLIKRVVKNSERLNSNTKNTIIKLTNLHSSKDKEDIKTAKKILSQIEEDDIDEKIEELTIIILLNK